MAGLSSLGVPGVHGKWQPPPFQILSDLLTPFQPRGADYAHQIILAPPDIQTLRRPCIHDRTEIWVKICSM